MASDPADLPRPWSAAAFDLPLPKGPMQQQVRMSIIQHCVALRQVAQRLPPLWNDYLPEVPAELGDCILWSECQSEMAMGTRAAFRLGPDVRLQTWRAGVG